MLIVLTGLALAQAEELAGDNRYPYRPWILSKSISVEPPNCYPPDREGRALDGDYRRLQTVTSGNPSRKKTLRTVLTSAQTADPLREFLQQYSGSAETWLPAKRVAEYVFGHGRTNDLENRQRMAWLYKVINSLESAGSKS
uniref:Uncharacterized protein n=1 Tax=Branchiostoma floridae TaxID=7739 RepID=C3ZK63_BRAFL|eukprot:XP_002590951.1 hypothetical protein BRAFLDRAFT_101106 [Branchiostoma floridae]